MVSSVKTMESGVLPSEEEVSEGSDYLPFKPKAQKPYGIPFKGGEPALPAAGKAKKQPAREGGLLTKLAR